MSRGIKPEDFNSYGSRRGNDLVMTRGTFANVRIKNLMVPGTEGGVTKYYGPATGPTASTSGEQMSIYDAAMKYQKTMCRWSFWPGTNMGPVHRAIGRRKEHDCSG